MLNRYPLGKQITSVPLIFRLVNDYHLLRVSGSASLSSDFDGWQISLWEVMVSWHSCTFISWEKLLELPHFIFLLLSLMLHDSKLMLKLYYLRVPTSLLTGCDTKVALDSRLSLGAWKQKLTTVNRKKQSVNGRNLLIEISLTKSSNVGSWSVEGK